MLSQDGSTFRKTKKLDRAYFLRCSFGSIFLLFMFGSYADFGHKELFLTRLQILSAILANQNRGLEISAIGELRPVGRATFQCLRIILNGRIIVATATLPQNSTESTPRAARYEHLFFGVIACLLLISVFAGFARTYFLAGFFRAKLPSLLVHVHGALFTLWIALLVTQVALAASGRLRWHMRLGLLGIFLAPLMVVTGFATLAAAIKRGFVPPPILQGIASIDTMMLCLFCACRVVGVLRQA